QYSTVADRYMYLAMLGPSVAGAWLLGTRRRPVFASLAAAIFLALGVASAVQAENWYDSTRLFAHAVSVSPDSPAGHLNYGSALFERAGQEWAADRPEEARRTMEQAVTEF